MKPFQILFLVLAITLAVESCKKSKTVRKITNAAKKVGKVAGKVAKYGGIISMVGRMDGDEEMDYKIEKAAFTLCDNEDDNALTWDEVEMCEVSIMSNYLPFKLTVLFARKSIAHTCPWNCPLKMISTSMMSMVMVL